MGFTDWLKQQWEGIAVGAVGMYFGKGFVEKKTSEYAENLGRKIAEGMKTNGGQDLKYKSLEDKLVELERKVQQSG